MQPLVVLVPCLGRPHRVAPLLESLFANTPEDPHVVFIGDPDDFEEHDAIREAASRWPQRSIDLRILRGANYAAKINHGVSVTDEPLIFLGADDLEFHPCWLEAAWRRLTPTVGVVGTQDLCNRRVRRGEHSTHSLVARWYAETGTIDEPDKLLHEGYPHEFVDDEFVETAIHRGAYVFAHDSVVEHLHPDVKKAPEDDLYRARPQRMRRGRRIYEGRRHLWVT